MAPNAKRQWTTLGRSMYDLQGRLANRVQLTTDGLRAYQQTVDLGFP
jgi:hypothetical protein